MNRFILLPAFAPLLIAASSPASLDVTVTGIKHMRGTVIACVWRGKPGFPTCQKSKNAIRQTLNISGGTMQVRFHGLTPGAYAVSVQHDEDGDGQLKTNFIGMPKEGVGISNNPGGIPSFGKSLVQVGTATAISIAMRYL